MNDGIPSFTNPLIDFLHKLPEENVHTPLFPRPVVQKKTLGGFDAWIPFGDKLIDDKRVFLNPAGIRPPINEGFVHQRGGELLGRLREAKCPLYLDHYRNLEKSLKEITEGHTQLDFAKTGYRPDILHNPRRDAIKVAQSNITAASEKVSVQLEKWAIAASHLEKTATIEQLIEKVALAKEGKLAMKAAVGGAALSAGVVSVAAVTALFVVGSIAWSFYKDEKISVASLARDSVSMALPLGASCVFDGVCAVAESAYS